MLRRRDRRLRWRRIRRYRARKGRIPRVMVTRKDSDEPREGRPRKSEDKHDKAGPGWANGLRELYDSVVDEDIPDSFKDLLSKLDEKD